MRTKFARPALFVSTFFALFFAACGAGSSHGPLNQATNNNPAASVPSSQTVFVIVLENKNYLDVVNPSAMPYFNGLFGQGALATQYFADVHPSMGNYFMLTTGKVETTDDSFTGTISDNNLVRALNSAGKTWKAYVESIPSAGYLGGDKYPYLRRHVPFTFFSDVQQSSAQAGNIVPLGQLGSDLGSGNLPNVAFIIPNAYDDGHDCLPNTNCTVQQQLSQADDFLKANVPNIVSSQAFQKGGGLLAVTFDESGNDNTHGGGRVVTFFLGPNVKAGYQSTAIYQHENLLRLICDSAGAQPMANAQAAATISDIFK